MIALQEFEQSQLAYRLPGYALLPGEPTGVSRHPRMIKRSAPVALLLWGLLWWWLGPPPWSFALTLLHAVLFAFGILAPLVLFALVRYRGPFRSPGEFVPILYRTDKLELLADGTVWLSNVPTRPGSNFPLQFEPRAAHWARFRPRGGGVPFLFINAHLGHAPWHYAGSARVLLELLAHARPSPEAPVYLVGDFNALPQAGVVRRLLSKFRPAWEDAERREGPETTVQWMLAPGMMPLRLDHVLYAGATSSVVARVLTPRGPDGRPPSDHDPLAVDFR